MKRIQTSHITVEGGAASLEAGREVHKVRELTGGRKASGEWVKIERSIACEKKKVLLSK